MIAELRSRVAPVVWLIAALGCTLPGFLWQMNHFRTPGDLFHSLAWIAIPLLIVAPLGYDLIRRRFLGWEAVGLGAFPWLLCAVYEPLATIVALTTALSAICLGGRIKRVFWPETENALEAVAVSFSFGLTAILLALPLIGAVGMLRPAVCGPLLTIPILLDLRNFRKLPGMLRELSTFWEKTMHGWMASIAAFFLWPLISLWTMSILVPARNWDVVNFHLGLSNYYVELQRFEAWPGLSYTWYPQGMELWMSLGLMLGGQAAAQLLVALFFPMLLMFSYLIARRLQVSPEASLVCVAATGSIPFLLWLGGSSKNDVGVAAFQLAGLYGLMRWLRARSVIYAISGALLAVMSAHIKLTAFFGLVPLGLMCGFVILRDKQRMTAVLGMLSAAVLAVVWLIRTKLSTDLFVVTFQPETVAGGRWEDEGGSIFQILLHLLQIPWQVHFDGNSAFEAIGPSSNPMGFALFLFGPIGLILTWSRGDIARRFCWLYVILYTILWGETMVLLRYGVGIIPVLIALTCGRVFDSDTWRGTRRILLAGTLSYAFTFGLCGAANVTLSEPMLQYFARQISKDQYLGAVLDTYSATAAARDAAAATDRIFGLESCNTSYVLPVSRYTCHQCPGSTCSVSKVQKQILDADYRWLVLSRNPRYDDMVKQLAEVHPLQQVYIDPLFVVYKWKNPTSPGIQ